MTKKKKVGEEEETTNEDAKEPFAEVVKYYKFMELLSYAQFLKIMSIVEVCLHFLMVFLMGCFV